MSVELDESGGGSRGRALGTDETAEQLERVLRSTVTSGHVGALSLDPKYFVFEAAPRKCFYFFYWMKRHRNLCSCKAIPLIYKINNGFMVPEMAIGLLV